MNDDKFQPIDIYERLGRIEAKLDHLTGVKETADRALLLAAQNEKSINDIRANTKWLWGLLLPSAISIFVLFITFIGRG